MNNRTNPRRSSRAIKQEPLSENDMDMSDEEKERIMKSVKKIDEESEDDTDFAPQVIEESSDDSGDDAMLKRIDSLEKKNRKIRRKIKEIDENHQKSNEKLTKMIESQENLIKMYRETLTKTSYYLRLSTDIVESQNEILNKRVNQNLGFPHLNDRVSYFNNPVSQGRVAQPVYAPPVFAPSFVNWLARPPPPPPEILMTPPPPPEDEKPSICDFCQKLGHSSENCTEYTAWFDRRFRMTELGKCWRCLQKNNHPDINDHVPCPKFNAKCEYCEKAQSVCGPAVGYHHPLLCSWRYLDSI